MFPISSRKTCIIFHTQILNLLSRIYADMTLKPAYIGMCAKGQIVLEFSFMWIRVTCLLAFHMPWDWLVLTFHYPIEAYVRNPLEELKREELKSKKTIVHCFRSLLILESASPCPLENFAFFPSFPLLVRLLLTDGGLRWWRPRWRTPFLRFVDVPKEVVTCVISNLINRNIFSCRFNVELNEYWIHGYV